MTIKHNGKNISGESEYILTDIEDNPNGILTLYLKNQWNDETITKTLDLTQHKLQLVKLLNQDDLELLRDGSVDDINEAFVGNYIDEAFEDEEEVEIYRDSKIFLVPYSTNDEGIYREYMWINGDFETIGSTDINLEPFFLKENVYNGLDYSTNNTVKVLSAYQGYVLNRDKIDKSSIVNNLTTSDTNKVLSATQGKTLQDNKVDKTSIIDNLTTNDADKVLSAKQGKVLQDNKVDKTSITDNLTTNDTDKVLSAKQGKVLQDNKVDKTSITDNLTTDDASKVLSAKQGKLLQDNKVNKTDIVDYVENDNQNAVTSNAVYDHILSSINTHNSDTNAHNGLMTTMAEQIETIQADINAGTFADLQTIINNANSGDIINLKKDYKRAHGEVKIIIDKPITINGNSHVIDGDGSNFDRPSVLINITSSDVHINNLIVMNGWTFDTGSAVYAIHGISNISLIKCIFINNRTTNGAPVFFRATDGKVIDCLFYKNEGADFTSGGALRLLDNSIAINNIFLNNKHTSPYNSHNVLSMVGNPVCYGNLFLSEDDICPEGLNKEFSFVGHTHTSADITDMEGDFETNVDNLVDSLILESKKPYYDFFTHEDGNDDIVYYNLEPNQSYVIDLEYRWDSGEIYSKQLTITTPSIPEELTPISVYEKISKVLLENDTGNHLYIEYVSCKLLKNGEPILDYTREE